MSRSRTVLLTTALVTAALLTPAAASAAPLRSAVPTHGRLTGLELELELHEAVLLGFQQLPEADRVHLPQILKNLDQGRCDPGARAAGRARPPLAHRPRVIHRQRRRSRPPPSWVAPSAAAAPDGPHRGDARDGLRRPGDRSGPPPTVSSRGARPRSTSPVGAAVRPPVLLVPTGLPQLVGVVGAVIDESGGRSRSHPFHRQVEVIRRSGTVPILDVRITADHDVLRLDVHGALQADGALTVTIVLSLQHVTAGGEDRDDVDAETTVVPAGGATAFALTVRDGHGCRIRAHGSIANLCGAGR